MEFNINILDQEDANKFLRKLWAEFRKEFGKCAWQYMPFKASKSNKIIFGWMDIGIPEGTLQVAISYLKRGTIKTINFDLDYRNKLEDNNQLSQRIQAIIDISRSDFHRIPVFDFKTGVSSAFQVLGHYKGEAFSTYLSQDSRFNFNIRASGYDDIDARTECKRKILSCLDLFAVETNALFWTDNFIDKADEKLEEEIFMEDLEWIDDYPIISQKLRLSVAGKKLLDIISKDQLNKEQKVFLRACSHFHTARKYDAQTSDLLRHRSVEVEPGVHQIVLEMRDERLLMAAQMGAAHTEIASVLYISALEVASSIGVEESKNCLKCNQKLYSISRRVADMVERYLSDHLAKEFKGFYGKRSKYLHAGELVSNYSYVGIAIPQLDSSDPSGCKVYTSIPLLNLREYTSFCLRKILQSLVNDT